MIPRWRLGDEAEFAFQVRNASLTVSSPDAAPTLKVYDSAGTKVAEVSVPPQDRQGTTGWFAHFIRLGSQFATGFYSWRASWQVSSVAGVASGMFEIIGGGDPSGAVLSLLFTEGASGNQIVWQTDAGEVRRGRSPQT